MSLIIAIEPDRDQAAQLKDLVRRHTDAELILADTTDRAIHVLGERVPDLVLIPPFLSPQDDEALTSALRAIEAAAHVQTLTIPMLGSPETRTPAQGGVLSRLLRDQPRPVSPDSCDPKMFADQISQYLERVAKDRPRAAVVGGNGNTAPAPSAGSRKGKGGGSGASTSATARPAGHSGPSRPALPAAALPAAAPPAAQPPPPPAPVPIPAEDATDAAAIEAALAEVAFDEPGPPDTDAPASPQAAAATPDATPPEVDDAALEDGLAALMEKLSVEEPAVEPAPTPDPTAWLELKELESIEYAMPSNVPHDEPAPSPPAAAAPVIPAAASPPDAAAPKPASEWGDLMESLKKDLGR